MTTNRNLIDHAAKAARIEIRWERSHSRGKVVARQHSEGYYGTFDPLNDSYTALWLSGRARITLNQSFSTKVVAEWMEGGHIRSIAIACDDSSRDEAARRAIVRAAAAIGLAALAASHPQQGERNE